MKIALRNSWLLGVTAALYFSASAFAGNVVFTRTGVTGGSLAGVYTSPYIANISSNPGVPTFVICDDYATDSFIGQTFVASVTNVASLTGSTASSAVKFDQSNAAKQQKDYVTAAYL